MVRPTSVTVRVPAPTPGDVADAAVGSGMTMVVDWPSMLVVVYEVYCGTSRVSVRTVGRPSMFVVEM